MRLRQSALALSRCSAEVLAGRYRLDARIGSGGAADVHRGFDLRLKRPVAVKVFRTGADTDMEERFSNEAVILARLQHPGLVTAYDAGRHNGHPYLIMQLIEGPTLKDRIAGGSLTPGETAALGAGLARALAHAHEAGIVHRDVKPSNIILDASGHPHLTDFGISRLLDATTRTASGVLIGTAAYLSPEQVLGRPVGPPADIYALGLVLLECLTTRLEYEGAPLEAAIARLHRPPELPGSLPEEFAAVLRDMTALDESARPSAPDCARSLAALAGTTEDPSVPVPVPAPVPAQGGGVTSIPGGAPAWDADPTHPRRAAETGATAPKAALAPPRVLVAGGAAALAAVMAATFAVSDGSPGQGSGDKATRAVSGPSAQADPPGASARRSEAGVSSPTPESATPEVSAARPRASGTPEVSAARPRASAAPGDRATSTGTSRQPATFTAAEGTATSPRYRPSASAPNSRPAETSDTSTPTEAGAVPEPSGKSTEPTKAGKPQSQGKGRKGDKG
ncbi:protein kinase [Streptomyces sp. NPDC007904]|uniref:serine/threonine-protein kinase n=1 Tax=Streptomyces sp. NPDC007904 TaxID=3364787 RepID=UPI0036E27CE7